MSKFILSKKLDLSSYGQGAYLEFGLLSFKDIRKLSGLSVKPDNNNPKEVAAALDQAIELLKSNFITGKLPDGSKNLVEVVSSDLEDLPMGIINEAMGFLSGGQTKA